MMMSYHVLKQHDQTTEVLNIDLQHTAFDVEPQFIISSSIGSCSSIICT